ncbi:MAG: type II secretion system protein GspL [Proteobacteria bacterium]|nr:type II secretion system protein GspL [Pseudomonadota bacterium]
MSEYVIVRINEQLVPEFQINYNASANTASKSSIASWQQVSVQKSQKLILILSANLVLNTQIKIPSKNEEIIRQSIPFALEEQIASNIEDNHFAYTQLAEQLFLVSIVAKSHIFAIQQALSTHGLKCEKMYSEVFSVPRKQDTINICATDESFIVNEDYAGTLLNKALLTTYIKLSKTKNTTIYTSKQIDSANDAKIDVQQTDTNLLQAQTLNTGLTVNLFQGEFAQNSDKQKRRNPWKKLLTLAVTLMLSWLLINLYQWWSLTTTIDDIKQKQQVLLLQLIPDASQSEKNNPYAAIKSRLQIAQTSQGTSQGEGFIQALIYLGQTLQQHPDIQVHSLRQRQSKLEIQLQAQNVGVLNSFQASLEKNILNMRIKTGTRDTNKDGINSIITMERL